MTTMALNKYIDVIQHLMTDGKTYDEVSSILKVQYGMGRGSSAANVRLFCKEHNINHNAVALSTFAVDVLVNNAICEVNITCNYKNHINILVDILLKYCTEHLQLVLTREPRPY